ncbi:MAG: M16 family metallopeptidase, partial [Anaerolineae bacterium]
WLESDRMASLAVTQEAFDTERQVVIEEFNQRVANRPYGFSNLRLFTQAMQGYPPYERAVIGSVEDLQAATLPEVQQFFETYYQPNNATLVIVGDIDIGLTQTLVQAYFGDIPAGQAVVPVLERYPLPDAFPALRLDPATSCQIGYEETLIDAQVELPRHAASVVGPPRGTPDFYALSLLADILGSGDSSRFQRNIVQEGLAASAFIGLQDFAGASLLFTGAFPNAGDSIEAVQAAIRAEFDQVIAGGVTEAELDRVKTRQQISTINSFRESALNSAEWLQDAILTFGDPAAIAGELAQFEAVTLDDIQRAAETYLCNRPMNVLVTLPEGAQVLAEAAGPVVEPVEAEPGRQTGPDVLEIELTGDVLAGLPAGVISRTEVPAALPVSESSLPPFESFTLDNGLQAIFVEQGEVPKLRLQLFVGGSNASVPADKQGVADFMAELLTKGTAIRSADQIAQRIESVGGSVGASAALEWISLSLEAPTANTRLAFNLLANLARDPTFPQPEFDVLQERTLTLLAQDEVNPGTLANRQFNRIAYGNHPYGYNTLPETVENLAREDVVEFYQTFVKPNNALLVIVGDISAEEARAQTERVFGGWPSGPVPDFLDYPQAILGDTSVIYLVDRPASEQATIHVGNRAINARSPDRYALLVTNTVLGSGASSRLFLNLREDKGYTYGVSSRFGRPNDTSTFRVISNVAQDHAGDAIREILMELETIRTETVPAPELLDAKGLLIGSFALSIENPANYARQLASRHLTGLPPEELNTYLQQIEAVTADETLAAAAEYIDSEQPIIVVVGDAALVKSQLEELGPVVVVDNEGNIIDK